MAQKFVTIKVRLYEQRDAAMYAFWSAVQGAQRTRMVRQALSSWQSAQGAGLPAVTAPAPAKPPVAPVTAAPAQPDDLRARIEAMQRLNRFG